MYCAKADLTSILTAERLIEMTDDAGTGVADDAVISRAIGKASGEIDAYCGQRYALPLTPVPDVARDYCADMAAYHLFARRMGAPEEWKNRYDRAVSFFKDVASEKANLPSVAGVSPAPQAGGTVRVVGPARVFDRDTLGGL
jgi:phage gp36-like protein